jgi:hypothetical protein
MTEDAQDEKKAAMACALYEGGLQESLTGWPPSLWGLCLHPRPSHYVGSRRMQLQRYVTGRGMLRPELRRAFPRRKKNPRY